MTTLSEHLAFARSCRKPGWNKDFDYKELGKIGAAKRWAGHVKTKKPKSTDEFAGPAQSLKR